MGQGGTRCQCLPLCGGAAARRAPGPGEEFRRLEEEVRALRAQLAETQLQVRDLQRDVGWRTFTVAQYNILASYLGDNRQPWFLHGTEVSDERRAACVTKFYEKDAATGAFANEGWPRWAQGILSEEEQRTVEDVHRRYFAWEVREGRLREELLNLDADIFSLVELDQYEAVRQWLPEHDGVFEKRPRPSSKDGCGIFFRRSKFELLASRGIAFTDSVDKDGRAKQDRCGLMAILHFKGAQSDSSGQYLVVVSTHLARNPENSKMTFMRAKQVTQLARSLTQFTDEYGLMSSPVVMLGDMNAKDYGEISGIAQSVFQVSGEQVHPFFWQADDIKTGPTSVTSSRNVRIDVILFQPIHLKVLGVGAEQHVAGEIPDAQHPSDHIPVSVRFQVKADHRKNLTRASMWLQSMLGEKVVEPLTEQELKDAFDFFDYDRSGHIDRSELEVSCSELNSNLSSYQQEILIKCFPMELISFNEFASAYEIQFQVCRQRSLSNICKAFRFFDVNGDGALTFEEFCTAVSQVLPVVVDDWHLKEIWRRLQPDEQGCVDITSFCHEMCNLSTIPRHQRKSARKTLQSQYHELQEKLRSFRGATDSWSRGRNESGVPP